VLAFIKTIFLFVVVFLFKPLRVVLRFFYYTFLVRIYGFYLSFVSKLGFKGYRTNIFSFFFNQKFVHIVVVLLTTTLVFVNFTAKTKAGQLSTSVHRTVLADLVRGEFENYESDEQLIVETFDSEAFISDIQQSYLDETGSAKIKLGINQDIEEDEEITNAQILSARNGQVLDNGSEDEIVVKKRTEIETHVVEKGDTISTIAQNFGISVSTILWENNLNAYSVIRPGDKLKILPFNGVKHQIASGENLGYIANKYDVDIEKITSSNNITANSTLKLGQVLMIPDGKKVYVAAAKTKVRAYDAIKSIVKAPNAKPVVGNKMQWPTVGHRITQYYNWRHHGLDIANKTGTPLYAADSGTVEVSGWGRGYGYQVLIDHGGGKKTRYAHASKLFVEKGDTVAKGETIAAMGSTGWSTGPHIHFEVIINGTKYNPLNYIK
jgi:murein DD-endopeptidase MepM/ murein hydrolase activator NlpD